MNRPPLLKIVSLLPNCPLMFLSVGISHFVSRNALNVFSKMSRSREISLQKVSLKINNFRVSQKTNAKVTGRETPMIRISPINRDGLRGQPDGDGARETRRNGNEMRRSKNRRERLGVHWRGNRRDKRAEASPLIVSPAAWNSANVCARAMSVGVRPCWKVHYITTLGVATFPAARASWLIVKLLHRRYLLVNGVELTNREYISRLFLYNCFGLGFGNVPLSLCNPEFLLNSKIWSKNVRSNRNLE